MTPWGISEAAPQLSTLSSAMVKKKEKKMFENAREKIYRENSISFSMEEFFFVFFFTYIQSNLLNSK